MFPITSCRQEAGTVNFLRTCWHTDLLIGAPTYLQQVGNKLF